MFRLLKHDNNFNKIDQVNAEICFLYQPNTEHQASISVIGSERKHEYMWHIDAAMRSHRGSHIHMGHYGRCCVLRKQSGML